MLKENVIPSSKIQIAHLPKADDPCPNELVVSGWGIDNTRSRSKRYLWAVKQKCLNISMCQMCANVGNMSFCYSPYRYSRIVLCVGGIEDGLNGPCTGDSGGVILNYS